MLGYGFTEYLRLKRYDEALAAIDKALEIDPNDAIFWNNKGYALNGLKRYDEALAVFDRALEIDPDEALAWKNRGETHSRLGDRHEALAHLRKAVKLDPSLASRAMEQGLYQSLREDEEFKQIIADAQKAAGE